MNKSKGERRFSLSKLPMDIGRSAYYLFFAFTRMRRHTVSGTKEPLRIKGGAVLVANHSGFSDPFVIAAAYCKRRMHFIAAIDVMPGGILKKLLEAMGCIMIDRRIFDVECIKKSISLVKSGRLLAMFPQGGIVKNGEIDSIKSGAILIASQADVPIVPIYIKKRIHWWSRAEIVIGERFLCSEYCGKKYPGPAEIAELTEILLEKTNECKKVAERIYGGAGNEKNNSRC